MINSSFQPTALVSHVSLCKANNHEKGLFSCCWQVHNKALNEKAVSCEYLWLSLLVNVLCVRGFLTENIWAALLESCFSVLLRMFLGTCSQC